MSSENAAIVARVGGRGLLRGLLNWFLRRVLSRVSVDPEWVQQVRDLSKQGTVVHVLLKLSLLDFLVLDQLCRAHELPPIKMITGPGRYAIWPFRWLLALLWRRCSSCDVADLRSPAEKGEASLIFLRPVKRFALKKRASYAAEATEALVQLQRKHDRPLLLVPHNIFWGRRRHGSPKGNLWSWWLQQLREGPGILRLLARIMRARRDGQIRLCDPVNLKELVDEGRDKPDDQLARDARFTLLRRIERERKVVLGPMAKSAEAIRDGVLRSAALGEEIRRLSKEQGIPKERLRRRARKLVKEIQAVPKSGYLAALNALMWWAWSRLFEHVEIDREGLARWREVAHEGPLVIISSHKSHVDYLILSQLFWEKGIFPPHIAAGRNLSFWPLGPIFRGCGAFFIRRKFMSDDLYVAVLEAYIKKILQEGYHLEFFIEGTRSRSGKLLPPKLGMLGMIVDAARRLPGHKVHIAPASVTYGRVPEERSHAAEAEGKSKKGEDIGELLRTRHLLGRRHGVLYAQFGNPIDVHEYFREQGAPELEDVSESERHRLVANLAYRTVHEINRVTLITPTALVSTVLLLNRRRGMSHSTLQERVDELARCLGKYDAQFTTALARAPEEGVPPNILLQATRFLSDANLVSVHDRGEEAIYTVATERRLALDFYKNSTLHPLVNVLMVGAAMGTANVEGRAWGELAERVRFLSRLLKYEFTFRADAVFEVNLEQTVNQLLELDELARDEDRVYAPGHAARQMIRYYASMVENFVESYRIVIRHLRHLGDQAATEKELVKQALTEGERMYLVGEIELREARSKFNFQYAVWTLRDMGVLEKREGKQLALTEEYRDPEMLEQLERQVASYLIR